MGVPGSSTGEAFHSWAQLPISREIFNQEQKEQQRLHFPQCTLLPGVEKLLLDLKSSQTLQGKKVSIALASSTNKRNFELKTARQENKVLLEVFNESQRVLGDDPKLQSGRGKPSPDIFLLALQTINDNLSQDEDPVTPEECLVFEDSIVGVEAGRRAKMRVVWVPHPALANEYAGREQEILAGRCNLVTIGEDWQLGDIDDGWATQLTSLEHFPYDEFGIQVLT